MKDTRVEEVFDPTAAGERAKRHPKTVLRALRKGELRGYQAGPGCGWRIFESDLDAWIRGERPARKRAA